MQISEKNAGGNPSTNPKMAAPLPVTISKKVGETPIPLSLLHF